MIRFSLFIFIIFMASVFISCAQNKPHSQHAKLSPADLKKYDSAVFAGGCFWSMEASFERIIGVKETVSGYAGGDQKNPTYSLVSSGTTDYAESVMVYYDKDQVSYEELLKVFFTAHDPTQVNRQGPDIGTQYRSVVFYQTEAQKRMIENYINQLIKESKYDKPIATEISKLKKFYPAEDYHQEYYDNHPNNPYIRNVSKHKVDRVMKVFHDRVKDEYLN